MIANSDGSASIDFRDEHEYAWLLVRTGTATGSLIRIWRFVPIRQGSLLAAALGYPLRLLLVLTMLLLSCVTSLIVLIAIAQIPVLAFAYVRPVMPDPIWSWLLGSCAGVLGVFLAVVTGIWLQKAARGHDPLPRASSGISDHVVAQPVAQTEGWNHWSSLHVSHNSARSALFAGISIVLGVVLQCLAVTVATDHFSGPVDTAWRWPLSFGQQLLNTALFGIPEGNVPNFGEIEPVTLGGRLLTVGVDVFYAAGLIAFAVQSLGSVFRVRELFNGTARDLADYLENFDVSPAGTLTIHRVAVVRPLDESQCITLTKEQLFMQVKKP